MSSIVISGDTSGSVTLQAPAVAGSTVLNLPSTSGTIQTSGAGYTTNGVAYATSTSALATGSALTFDGTNVGVGAATPSFSNFSAASSGIEIKSASTFGVLRLGGTNGQFYLASGDSGGSAWVWNYTNSALIFGQNNTEGMRLTSTGLGIGTSSPTSKLDVTAAQGRIKLTSSTGTNNALVLFNNTGGNAYVGLDNSGGSLTAAYALNLYHEGPYPITFSTNNSEKARITSAGELLLTSLTSPIASGILCIATNLNNNNPIVLKNTTTQGASQTFVVFYNSSNVQAGGIFHSGSTSVTYSTSSDVRLKTDLGVAISTDVIDNTIIHDYEWKEDKKIDRGVFAQEAYQVKPSAVAVGNDELTEDGNLAKPWGVDYSKYVPDLIVHAQQLKKQVQEQQALINTLTDRITALEGV